MCRFPPTWLMRLTCGKVCGLRTSSRSQTAKRTSRRTTSSNIAMSAWGQPSLMIPRSLSSASLPESARWISLGVLPPIEHEPLPPPLSRKMGMAPADIGKLLGHTNPARSLPWYMREDKHHLGRAYRKANPLERYVAAIPDTNAHARQEPCVFYYLSDGPDGRPRMCGNPHFSRCIHQLQCIECEAFIDHEQAEAIEKREGAVLISVPIPLPPQMVAEWNEQDEAGNDGQSELEALPPPVLPGPAFHFNKKVPLRSA